MTKLSNEWSLSGHSVTFVVADSSKPYYPVAESVHVLNLNCNVTRQRWKSLKEYIYENFYKYDLYIANHNATTIPIFLASRKRKNFSKNYYYIQAYEPEFYDFSSVKRVIKLIISQISYKLPFIKIVNADIYRDYKLVHTDKVVYPGLDLGLYYNKDIQHFACTIKIGTIGRTEPWKGTETVCRAMELLRADGINFEFYVAFNDFDTVDHHFVKPDGDENLSAFYREMDIVVAACKGQHGAIHYPIIESMAVGTSVVCTDYYPANATNAYVVEEDSPRQIADAVKRIISNKNEAVEKRQRALEAVQQFDWPVVAQKFLDYLRDN